MLRPALKARPFVEDKSTSIKISFSGEYQKHDIIMNIKPQSIEPQKTNWNGIW